MKMNIKKRFIALAGIGVLCAGISTQSEAFFGGLFGGREKEEVFRMGLLPNEDSVAVGERYEILTKDLSDSIGMKVETVVVTDYNAAVEGMANGHVDLMFFGPFSYAVASERANAEAIAITTSEPEDPGAWTYTAKYIVKNDSDIESVEDLRNKSFAFVDPASASGNLFPRAELINYFDGVTNEDLDTSFFSEIFYSGSHDNSILAVLHGDVDAAAVSSNIFTRVITRGMIEENDLRVVFESRDIPRSPWAMRGDHSDEIKDKVKDFLLSYDNPEYIAEAHSNPNTRFVEITDEAYDVVRDTARVMGLDVNGG